MRPDRFTCLNSLSAKSLPVLAAILFALTLIPAGAAHASRPAAQSSSDPVYDAPSFVQELGRLKAELDRARNSSDALRSYRESLPAAWTVDAGGHRYGVLSDLLVERIVKAESQPELRTQQLDQARDYLDALAAETASLSGQPPPPTDSARAKLNAILARPEYVRSRQPSWWDKLRARIDDILLTAWERLVHRAGGQASFAYALLWIGVCVAAILIAYSIFRRWFRAAGMAEMALQAAAIPLRSWQEWVYAARQAAASGDYRLAIHCAYWAGIVRLQDLGALAPDRAKTPREYLRALTQSKVVVPDTLAARQQALSLLTSRLEKTWYGYRLATESDFRDSLTQLEILGCHLP